MSSSQTTSDRLLDVRDLRTVFHTPEGVVRAVNGISYTLPSGGALGVVGESGSGKSVSVLSLLRLIPEPAGQIAGGEAWLGDRNLLGLSPDDLRQVRGRDIGIVFQDPLSSLNPVLTIGRQITEALEEHLGYSPRQARERGIDLLNRVGIPDAARRIDNYPHQFSGGMRQRAMIAMAIACDPKLLIADEPTTALDVTIQAQILDLIARLREQLGTAVILITHDLSIVAGLCDRVIVMYAGYIVEEASVVEIFENPRHPYTLGLLGSIPAIDRDPSEPLTPIDGSPPDLLNLPTGCPFAARCRFVVDHCRTELPPLDSFGTDHRARCWVNVNTGAER
ncbi:MAG: ABC transporter ATP-binding protein [Candidatus Limnocylindrales bacterium]